MTYLIDTSIWVTYFRVPDGHLAERVDAFLTSNESDVIGCPPVRMELSVEVEDLRRRRLLRVYDGLLTAGILADDFDLAAAVFRACRLRGHTIRSHMDCLIAAIAMRVDATLVHNDLDFDRMAEVIPDLAVLRLPDR
jgi:predicted nucleic acid-binding protein